VSVPDAKRKKAFFRNKLGFWGMHWLKLNQAQDLSSGQWSVLAGRSFHKPSCLIADMYQRSWEVKLDHCSHWALRDIGSLAPLHTSDGSIHVSFLNLPGISKQIKAYREKLAGQDIGWELATDHRVTEEMADEAGTSESGKNLENETV